MKNARPTLAFMLACAFSLPTTCSAAGDFFAALTRAHPKIKWDRSSLVTTDLNGDKIMDGAALGYKGDQIIIGVSMGHTGNGRPQLLPFGIGDGAQAAICALPATLGTEPLICTVDGDRLPGCKQLAGATGLFLSGGECDSVHLYWDHRAKRMDWWRL